MACPHVTMWHRFQRGLGFEQLALALTPIFVGTFHTESCILTERKQALISRFTFHTALMVAAATHAKS